VYIICIRNSIKNPIKILIYANSLPYVNVCSPVLINFNVKLICVRIIVIINHTCWTYREQAIINVSQTMAGQTPALESSRPAGFRRNLKRTGYRYNIHNIIDVDNISASAK